MPCLKPRYWWGGAANRHIMRSQQANKRGGSDHEYNEQRGRVSNVPTCTLWSAAVHWYTPALDLDPKGLQQRQMGAHTGLKAIWVPLVAIAGLTPVRWRQNYYGGPYIRQRATGATGWRAISRYCSGSRACHSNICVPLYKRREHHGVRGDRIFMKK